MILPTLLNLPNFVLVCFNFIPNKMRIWHTITLISMIFISLGLPNNCTFSIGNISLLDNEDILTIYLDTFDSNYLQSTLDIFTIQVDHEGLNCTYPPFTIEYTLKIYAPEIGLNRFETFYIGEAELDTVLTSKIYSSSNFSFVSGLTNQAEKLISFISQSGKLPNGKYLFQFVIRNSLENVLDIKTETLEINSPQALELLSPGGSLSELNHSYTYSTVPLFTWYSDFCRQCTYGIRLSEFNQEKHGSLQASLADWSLIPYDQSIKYYEIPWNTYSFQYPAEGHIDLEVGKHYVWQIRRSYETTFEPHHDYSPIFVFEVRSPTKKQLDLIDPYLSMIQTLIGEEQFNLWFSTGGELERFVTAGESIWINGEEIHIDVLYSLVSELNQGKITIENIQIK